MKRVRPLAIRGHLKAKVYWNMKDGSVKFVTEDKKEYTFTDSMEAHWYFEGLGYLDVRMTDLFLTVPGSDKTFHFKERYDPRGIGIDGYILECVTPFTEEEGKILKQNLPWLYTWKHADFVI